MEGYFFFIVQNCVCLFFKKFRDKHYKNPKFFLLTHSVLDLAAISNNALLIPALNGLMQGEVGL